MCMEIKGCVTVIATKIKEKQFSQEGSNGNLQIICYIFTQLDTELHDLLSAMADARPGQESMQKMTNAALLCRKITICHPALMIRYLSVGQLLWRLVE